MSGPGWVAAAVPAADPRTLLPPLRAGEEDALVRPLRLVAAQRLGTSGWASLLADAADTCVAAPLVRTGADVDGVRRASAGDGASVALLRLLAGDEPLAEGFATPLGDGLGLDLPGDAVERGVGVDQTHDSVVVADAAVVKWTVHALVQAEAPQVAALRHLAAVGFDEVPRPLGFLVVDRPEGQVVLAHADTYLPGAADGWDWYVDALRDWLEGRADDDDAVGPSAHLGDLVGRLHVAFATSWAGTPEPVATAGADDTARWCARACASLAEALDVTAGEPGERLRARADAAVTAFDAVAAVEGTPVTRVHGDLHVGQVLRWDGGYAVSDFDGNPVLPAAERAAPAPPARDVAGMLRSLDHVGRIVDRRTSYAHRERLATWNGDVRGTFLAAYRATLAAGGRSGLFDERLLHPFEVEQECRELVYAARHLPRWTYVPDAALADLLPVEGSG